MAQVALELGHMALRGENYGDRLVAHAFELLDADAGVGFTIWHPRTNDIHAEVFGTRPLSEQEARRASAFTAAHPGFRAMARVQTNQPVRISDHTDMRRFWGTETYEAMHGHSDGRYPASAVLVASRAEVVFLGVHRQRRDFTDADIRALSILQRPIAAALAFRAALDETIDLLQNGENALPHTRDAVSGGLRSPALNSAAGLCTDYRPTRREAEVLALTAEGWTNQQIGRRLGIAERTVRKHLEAVYDKAGVRGRAAAAVWWQRLNG